MAVAAFWSTKELKLIVFACLHYEGCEADLARCARVHSTWTEIANDSLWLGHSKGVWEEGKDHKTVRRNDKMTQAIASLPQMRRQNFASRLSVLDMTDNYNGCNGLSAHNMFDGLEFPKLKALRLQNDHRETQHGMENFPFSRYLRSTLETLCVVDESDRLMKSLLMSFSEQCPKLKHIFLQVPHEVFRRPDLARFFRSIRPVKVCLAADEPTNGMFINDLLSALSAGGGLEILVIRGFSDGLRLEHIARMSQLRLLEIAESGAGLEMVPLPPKDHSALGTLSQLHTLRLRDSFFPSQHDFDEADARAMFSGLSALENLSINQGWDEPCGSLLRSISLHCPNLTFLEIHILHTSVLTEQQAPLFSNLKEMAIDIICTDLSIPETVTLIDTIAPVLKTLRWSLPEPMTFTREVCAAFASWRSFDV